MTTSPKPLALDGPAGTGTSAPEDELDLVRRLREGDEEAFAGIVERYHATLVRLAVVFVRTEASAEEVVQDVWAAVIEGLETFEARSSLKTWIFRILTNRAKTRGVRERRTEPLPSVDDEDDGRPAVDPSRFGSDGMWTSPPRRWGDSPEGILLRQEAVGLVLSTIDRLPPRQRAVILLRDVEGQTAEEVCNVLEINETNQRVLLHRARMEVRRVLEQYLSENPK
jgi:RNA polymerase sigma-70 factor (ECF subfamily)